jgi:hypothetical protein
LIGFDKESCMKETLREKFNTVKTNVKQAWDKTTDEDKTKIRKDIKDRNYSGLADTAKDSFRRSGKV